MRIAVSDIRTEVELQARTTINLLVVGEIARILKLGIAVPPIEVYTDGETLRVTDGHHRLRAYQSLRYEFIDANVINGTRDEAIWAASAANKNHGVLREESDKRRAVELALKVRANESDRAIAQHCGVSHELASRVRRQLSTVDSCAQPQKTKGKDGKTRIRRRSSKSAKTGLAEAAKTRKDRAPKKEAKPPKMTTDKQPKPIRVDSAEYRETLRLVLKLPEEQWHQLIADRESIKGANHVTH